MALACVACLLPASAAIAAEATAAMAWRSSADFHRQMAQPVGLTWRRLALRTALAGLARSQRTAIFLDRRVDPDREVELSVHSVALEQALRQLAADQGLGLGYVGPVVYLGPPQVTSKLATLLETRREQLAALPVPVRRRLVRRRRWHWPALAQPRRLVEDLAGELAVVIRDPQQVPHDLWPATDLPPLTFTQRLTLVLTGFQLTFEFVGDDGTVKLIPIPDRVVLRRDYRVNRNRRQVASKLAQICPAASIVASGSRVRVEGSVEDHAKIKAYLLGSGQRKSTPSGQEKRFHLRVVNKPAATVIASLAAELGLTVTTDPDAAPRLTRRVTLQVADVTLDQLLDATLQPVGLSHERDGTRLVIRVRSPQGRAP